MYAHGVSCVISPPHPVRGGSGVRRMFWLQADSTPERVQRELETFRRSYEKYGEVYLVRQEIHPIERQNTDGTWTTEVIYDAAAYA